MPRTARKKEESGIYHVMARSISEILLFKTEDDKKKYLMIIKEYQKIFNFVIYAYCIMDNHVHLIIYSNGADISKIMHCINFKYAMYFNKKYDRHGHLFQDRFKSKVVNDDRYLIALSAYIHNNPVDVNGYENNPESYRYSSLGLYLGLRKDEFNIVNKKFILDIFDEDKNKAKRRYFEFITKSTASNLEDVENMNIEFDNDKSEYRSEKTILIRNYKIEDIIQYVVDKFAIKKSLIYIKCQRKTTKIKGALILLLRNLCNMSCKDICSTLGNITSSRVSKLCSIGVEFISNDDKYSDIVDGFLKCYSH
ncbi:MAG: transposase [Bacillota bacterium]|nr:transposase [Bacillota bacterium]